MNTLLSFEIAGNQLWRILVLFGIVLLGFILGKLVKSLFLKFAGKLERMGRPITAVAVNAVARSSVFLLASFGITLGVKVLKLQGGVSQAADTLSSMLISAAVGYILYWLVDVPIAWLTKITVKTESKLDDMLVPVIRKSLRVTVVLLVLIQIAQLLSNKPITSIIAGLGIGGLAVALAAQDTIKNVFGSFVLFADRPFQMGERIVVDGHDGPVEEVGLRSTKIRTLDGHLITVPNGELANKTIQNVGKRPFIKRTVDLTITYDTPLEKIDRALEIVKELLDNHEGMHEDLPPRAYFSDFNAESLNIKVIYWYHPPDYWNYMSFSEKFNKEVFRRFGDEGIEFAFPTRTVYLAGDPSRPLAIGKI